MFCNVIQIQNHQHLASQGHLLVWHFQCIFTNLCFCVFVNNFNNNCVCTKFLVVHLVYSEKQAFYITIKLKTTRHSFLLFMTLSIMTLSIKTLQAKCHYAVYFSAYYTNAETMNQKSLIRFAPSCNYMSKLFK